MGKDVLNDEYGRFFEIPLSLSSKCIHISSFSLSYRRQGYVKKKLNSSLDWTSYDLSIFTPFSLRRIENDILTHAYANKPCAIIAASDALHLGIGRYISYQTGIPLISDLYDNFESYGLTRMPFMGRLYRNALRHSYAVTCVSEPLGKHIRQYCGKNTKITTIENAVDSTVFRPLDRDTCRNSLRLPNNAYLIGTAGALDMSRDINTLYAAFKQLQETGQDIHLVLAGRCSGEPGIPDLENVHYLGEINHKLVPLFYNALDLAIVPLTDSEFGRYCHPQKACEILACKRPLVGASVGVMTDLFKAYPECLFDDGNSEMLANKIRKQMNSPVTPQIPIHDWADQAEKILELVKELQIDS